MRSKAANVITDNGVAAFLGENGKLTGVKLSNGTELPCELAIVATGVTPNVDLARAAGLDIGELGGIAVDQHMRTSDPDIYAVGDCVECTSLVSGRKVLAPYGDLANLQGRVAGQNVIQENSAVFPGITQTSICKIFDFTVGFTGLSEDAARQSGYEVTAAACSGLDIPVFMGGKLIVGKLVAETESGRILGFLLDTRGPQEFEQMRLGVGETLIPLGALRKRLAELPRDKARRSSCSARYPCAATRPKAFWKPTAGTTLKSWKAASWRGRIRGRSRGTRPDLPEARSFREVTAEGFVRTSRRRAPEDA